MSTAKPDPGPPTPPEAIRAAERDVGAVCPAPAPERPPGPAAEPRPILRVEYRLVPADLDAFWRYDARNPLRRRSGRWFWPVLWGCLAVAVVLSLLLPRPPGRHWWDGWEYPAYAGLIVAIAHIAARVTLYRARQKARRKCRFRSLTVLEVSPEGLSMSSSSGSRLTRWHAVVHIAESGDHAFLYVSPTLAIILPRAAFADDRHFEDFVETARHYQEEARRFVRADEEG